MPDPGLNRRLNQRSRRSGLIIGLSMLLTIGFCVGAFTVIYTALDGFTTDFVSGADATEPSEDEEVAFDPDVLTTIAAPEQNTENPADENAAEDTSDGGDGESETPVPAPTQETDDADEDDGFAPDYQVASAGSNINLREGPGTNTSILATLAPGTPLLYLDEDASTGGTRWMRFETEDGLEGWMRDVDTDEFET